MTEKRFTLKEYVTNHYAILDDKEAEMEIAYADHKSAFTICDLLNELHEEIQSLQFQLKECREHKLYSRRELEKENKQLKKPIKQILFSINSLIDKYAPNSDKMNILLELKEIILDDFGEEILE